MNRRRFFGALLALPAALVGSRAHGFDFGVVPEQPKFQGNPEVVNQDGRPCVMYIKHSAEKPWIWNYVQYTDGKGGAVAWAEKVEPEVWDAISYCNETAPW